jgi:hypothetical protein
MRLSRFNTTTPIMRLEMATYDIARKYLFIREIEKLRSIFVNALYNLYHLL